MQAQCGTRCLLTGTLARGRVSSTVVPHGFDAGEKEMDASDGFRGPGFGFVRCFLISILVTVGLMLGAAGLLSWRLGMDITVQGQGLIEPEVRHHAKTEISGIIRQVCVRQGQVVGSGDSLVALEDEEWRTELRKVNKEIEVNRSRRMEIERQMVGDRSIMQAEVQRAVLDRESAGLQLEQKRKEYELYYAMFPSSRGMSREPIDGLLPVRLRLALIRQTEADVERARRRLSGVETRVYEIRALDRQQEKLEDDRALLMHRLDRTVLRASVSGTVLTGELERRVGDRVEAGDTIVELAEMGGWQARVRVGEMDFPRVKVDQAARVYVKAFPHMEFKIFEGRVKNVPALPVVDGFSPDGPAYPVTVSIEDPGVSDGETSYALAYGMTAEAKIVVERGRIVDLLWRKLLRAAGKVARNDFYEITTPLQGDEQGGRESG